MQTGFFTVSASARSAMGHGPRKVDEQRQVGGLERSR